jgi:hypothetical protein
MVIALDNFLVKSRDIDGILTRDDTKTYDYGK